MNHNKNVLVLLEDWKDNYVKKNIGINIFLQKSSVFVYCYRIISGGKNLNIIQGRVSKTKSGFLYSLIRYYKIVHVLYKYNIRIINWCYITDDELLMICLFKLFLRKDLIIFVKSDSEDITNNKSFILRKYLYRNINRIFVESDQIKQKYQKCFVKSAVVTIYNPSIFEFYKFDQPILNKLIINKLLYVGRVDRNKNIDGLLNIFEVYATKCIDRSLTLVVIPDDLEYWGEIQLKIKELLIRGFSINVLINASIQLMYNAYLNSDILCITSFNEGVPNVFSDAFFMGLPVVAYSVGKIPNILSDDDLLCKDEFDFVEKLEKLNNSKLYEDKKSKFLNLYNEKMSISFFKEKLLVT